VSVTWDIICTTCREQLWIGQGRQGQPPVLYTGDPVVMKSLADFIAKHAGADHHLHVVEDSQVEKFSGEFTDVTPTDPVTGEYV